MQGQHDMQLAQASPDPGFRVPGAPAGQGAARTPAAGQETQGSPPAAGSADTSGTGAPVEVAPVAGAPATDTSTRDLAVGGAVFLVLLIVFFFARNAFANHLVRRRVAPSAADMAGWLMFFGLAFISAAAVLALLNASKYLTVAVTGTLLAFGVASLAGALLAGRR